METSLLNKDETVVEDTECMICYEEYSYDNVYKSCGNNNCSFRMCQRCFHNLKTIDCPNCRLGIDKKKLEEETPLVDLAYETRLKWVLCKYMTMTFLLLQVPFYFIGVCMVSCYGLPLGYACYIGNIPGSLYLCFESLKDHTNYRQNDRIPGLVERIGRFNDNTIAESDTGINNLSGDPVDIHTVIQMDR